MAIKLDYWRAHRRRERNGVSFITVHGDQVDAFSPILARLAGT